MQGWIQLHRQLLDHPLWTCETFTRGQAWVDLLLLANHKDSFFYKRNIKISVKRGQLARSEVELADRWSWSRSKVRKFLKDLESEQQIVQQKSNVTQVVTIIKYEDYQRKEQQDVQQQDSSETPTGHQQDTYNKDNNYNNEKNVKFSSNDIPPIDPTETTKPAAGKRYEFAKIYSKVKPFNPNSAEFQNAYFQAVDVAAGEDVVNVAASMYVQYCEDLSKPIQYIPNAARWLDTRQFASDWKAETMKELEERAEKGDKEAETKYMKYYIEAKQK